MSEIKETRANPCITSKSECEEREAHEFLKFLRRSKSEMPPDWKPPEGTGPWDPAGIYDTLLELYEHGAQCFPDDDFLPPEPLERFELLGIVAWASYGIAPGPTYTTLWELWDVYESEPKKR